MTIFNQIKTNLILLGIDLFKNSDCVKVILCDIPVFRLEALVNIL